PQIIGDEILLSIAPEMSHFVSESKSNLVVKQSSVSTTVRLQDGQTAVLAGMTLQEEGDQSKKVPILGDIPIIRWLFRSDSTRASEKELLIFVTPVIK
ncbi:MAG TPA: secretin, partial [Firmicutes bacterium]|nr:secretin [Bacillota bacterium]